MIDASDTLAELAAAVEQDRAHTVRVAFCDHYGVLRGRRLTAEQFLAGATEPQAFCDGALVWDIRCDIFEEADFSNYRTGYPDLYARPDLATLRPYGWSSGNHVVLADVHDAHGHPIAVDPRHVLCSVARASGVAGGVTARLELHVPDDAVAASWAPGRPPELATRLLDGARQSGVAVEALEWLRPARTLRLTLTAGAALQVADSLVLLRTAAREVAGALGVRLTAMARTGRDDRPSALELSVELPQGATAQGASGRLADVELLLRPLPLAYGAGPPGLAAASGRIAVAASSDANPYLAVAALLAAASGEGGHDDGFGDGSYRAAIARFAGAAWLGDWLDEQLVHDALALARREADLRDGAVTAWDLERYWECG